MKVKTTGRFIMLAILGMLLSGVIQQCNREMEEKENKVVIYQVFTRLFGNTNSTNKPWGTIGENGVGKFNDFTDEALEAIRDLGVTHIWYTGVLHHAVIGDYTKYGISNDDPDVVKGRAGSPYAIKDYFQVNPDLAEDPAMRLEEFEALINRTHKAGLKVIIDIVPNHVARNYQSMNNPPGVEDFGAGDDVTVTYRRDNNFYYIPGKDFQVPEFEQGFYPLNGEFHPLLDGAYFESPARWTGNGARVAQPSMHDWYETVKINFGISPNGRKDFDELPEQYGNLSYEEHHAFWKDKDIPDTWKKFEHIVHFWIDKGVDGFRYDMAQMVPVEFWSYLNSSIKMKNPDAFLLSEIYIPELYRDYIRLGKMDYLYDKVQLYDTLRSIVQGEGTTDQLPGIFSSLADIEHNMLHFLENHDEHRIASSYFAGDGRKALPAMVVAATATTSPTMIYFAQEVGEKAGGNAGFGKAGRTTIYDYWGVPAHQRWMNNGAFDGGALSGGESSLREFYTTLLNYTISSSALTGSRADLHHHNRIETTGYTGQQYAFLRWSGRDRLLVVVNFDERQGAAFDLSLPMDVVHEMGLRQGEYVLKDALGSTKEFRLVITDLESRITVSMEPLESFILEI